MEQLQLYYPVRPFVVNQKWGVYRPEVYKQFHFTNHNGIDLALVNGQKIFTPVVSVVVRTGWEPKGAGNYMVLRSVSDFIFPDGIVAHVEITFMHMQEIYVVGGQGMFVGEVLGLGDNTGYSTGSHTHMRCRRIKLQGAVWVVVDKNDAQNSFDQQPFWNKIYADTIVPPFHHAFNTTVKFGMENAEVKAVQNALTITKDFDFAPTGFFGDKTRKAVLAFQLREKVDSVAELMRLNGETVGPKTRVPLNRLFNI